MTPPINSGDDLRVADASGTPNAVRAVDDAQIWRPLNLCGGWVAAMLERREPDGTPHYRMRDLTTQDAREDCQKTCDGLNQIDRAKLELHVADLERRLAAAKALLQRLCEATS